MNQKTIQALDTLAEEYRVFDATMQKVAFEHEVEDVPHAMASGVAEELDRAHKEQERLQDEPEFACEGIVTASKVLHNAACVTSAKLNGAFREVSNRRTTYKAVCAAKEPLRLTRVCSLIQSAPGELQMNTPEQKLR